MKEKKQNIILKALTWLNDNCDSLCLISVFITSIFPWFFKDISEKAFAFYGGAGTFCSMMFMLWYHKSNREPKYSLLYAKLAIVILIVGILALLVITIIEPTELSPFIKFLYTYFGALIGMIIGGFSFFSKNTETNS